MYNLRIGVIFDLYAPFHCLQDSAFTNPILLWFPELLQRSRFHNDQVKPENLFCLTHLPLRSVVFRC